MRKAIGLALASAALCISVPLTAWPLTEREISVPGFADFLAVDGEITGLTRNFVARTIAYFLVCTRELVCDQFKAVEEVIVRCDAIARSIRCVRR